MLAEPRSDQPTDIRKLKGDFKKKKKKKRERVSYLAFPCAKISVTDRSEEDS